MEAVQSFLKKFWKLFILFLIPLHIVAITWTAMLPAMPFYGSFSETSFYKKTNHYLNYYLIGTCSSQRWDLFTSLSDIHAYEVFIEAEDTAGNKLIFDPIIPGLKKFETGELRHFTFFLRMVFGMEQWVEPYIQRSMQEISDSGTPLRRAKLVIIQKRTRFLDEISKDGVIYYTDPREFGPYAYK